MLQHYRLTHLASLLLALSATTTATDTSSLITIHNTSPDHLCYTIEFSSGHFPTTSTCASQPGVSVPAGQTVSIQTGPGFNGALTAILPGNVKGARHEINYAADPPGSTWYDVDYQLGMSDSTLGPVDHRPRQGNKPSLSGEQDTLAKANAAWPHVSNQAELLKDPKYLQVGADKGKLTHVYMDEQAPAAVADFFQLEADFEAYLGPGSVAGEQGGSQMVKAADEKSWIVDTQQMEIVAY